VYAKRRPGLNVKRLAGKLGIPTFKSFGLLNDGIKQNSTNYEAVALTLGHAQV